MRLRRPSGFSADGQSGDETRANGLLWNFEELLTDLYDLSRVPECWQRFLTRLCTDLHASAGVIVRCERAHEPEQLLAAHLERADDYAKLKEAGERPAGNGGGGASILPSMKNGKLGGHATFSMSLEPADTHCLLRSLGIRHMLCARYAGDAQDSVCLAIGRMLDRAPFDETEIGRFAKVAPYFEWAIQLADLFAKMTANVKASTAVLDLLPTGVVILDEQGACVTMNRAAREALDPDGTALRFIKRNLPKAGAAEQNGDDPDSSPQVLTLPSHAPGQRSVAVLWDIPDDRPDQQRKLAFIMDPDHKHSTGIDVAALERIYGLTATEARVAALVAESNSVAEIAEQMGTTAHTVRTHLRHIFEKTGTERQVDLVHLLLQSPLALRLPRKRQAAKPTSGPAAEKSSLVRG